MKIKKLKKEEIKNIQISFDELQANLILIYNELEEKKFISRLGKRQLKNTFDLLTKINSINNKLLKEIIGKSEKRNILSYNIELRYKMPSKDEFIKQFGLKEFEKIKMAYEYKSKVWFRNFK